MEWSAVYLHNHKENYSEPTCFIGNTLYHHQEKVKKHNSGLALLGILNDLCLWINYPFCLIN